MRRQCAAKPTPSALHALVDALPDEALRPLLLELLRGVGMPAPTDPVEDPPSPRRITKPRRSRRPPKRKRRGPGRPRKAIDPDLDAKIIARRAREAARLRGKRRAAKQAAAASNNGNGASDGNSAGVTATAADLWQHAERLLPKRPWHAVAEEFNLNDALVLDAYRSRSLPPGITTSAIERFLELSPT